MKILFVCLGNICRSPMAEGVMKSFVQQHGLDWTVDSAGTEHYHVGEKPDRRAIAQCRKCGIEITDQRARRISAKDFKDFDIIYALSADVLEEIRGMNFRNSDFSKVKLLLDELYPGRNKSVPDPWYGNEDGFTTAYDLIWKACEAIVSKYSAAAQ